jgi:hypothetical protein
MAQFGQWKVKIGLALAGTVFGLVLLAVVLEIYGRVLNANSEGESFESVADIRAAMVTARPAGGSESLDLRDIVYPHPDDHIIYDLRPNLNVTFQKVPVRTNSCGMRGPEVSIIKAPETYRIALLGDSFAFGWGVAEEKIFARVLEEALAARAPEGVKIEVLNFGVPGYSTFQEVYRFLESGADFDPDAVLVYFINNDFGYPFMVRDLSRPGKLLNGLEFARLTWRAIEPDIEQQKMFLQGLDPNTTLKLLSDYTRAKGIDLAIAINPYKKWKQERWRLPIFKERQDVRLIDLSDPMREIISARNIAPETLQLPTDPHPNAQKHEMIGGVLASYYLGRINP